MIALGPCPWRSGGPMMGRNYINPPLPWETRMAKAIKRLWEGLSETAPSGTYIIPHEGGYRFGHWWRRDGGYRFEERGDRPTREECKDALASMDKAQDRKVRELNKRGKRRG